MDGWRWAGLVCAMSAKGTAHRVESLGSCCTPAQTVRAALDSADFDPVRAALSALSEGPLAGYEFEPKEPVGCEDFELVDADFPDLA